MNINGAYRASTFTSPHEGHLEDVLEL